MIRYLKYLLVLVPVLWISGCKKPLLPTLQETYEKADKNPFGSFIAFNTLENSFKNKVEVSMQSLSKINTGAGKTRVTFFVVAQNLVLTRQDVHDFIKFINSGNDLFISADYIDPQFLDEINCSTMRIAEILSESKGSMRNTFVNAAGDAADIPDKFSYYYYPFLNYFPHFDKRRSQVLGYNEAGLPNFISYSNKGGTVFIHLAPRTFGNYFLLTQKNYKYLQYVLKVISPNQPVYWDEFYKRGDNLNSRDNSKADEQFSALRVVKREPALLWAFWVGVAAILLFVFFKIKRRQRMIPEVAPPENATVEFTETIAALYLQNKNNKNIAEKRIAYFYENISNRYFVGATKNQTAIFRTWAQKKGAGEEQVNRLLDAIANAKQRETLTDEELIELNALIDEF